MITMTSPVAAVRQINDQGSRYDVIILWCPGCEYVVGNRKVGGAHMLPISGDKKKRPTWDWNGDLVKVTLNPSVLTKFSRANEKFVCHSFLRNGMWQFLGDCTHRFKNQIVPMSVLPDWLIPDEG